MELAGVAVGDTVLFAGGIDQPEIYGSTCSAVVDIYNSTTASWSVASLSEERYHLAAVSIGGKALFGGGNNCVGPSSVVDIYDSKSGVWSISALSQARYDLAAAAAGTTAVFAGALIDWQPSTS